jgi:hypothetical protein
VAFLNWSFNSRHVILIFSFHSAPPPISQFGCLLSSTSASICKSRRATLRAKKSQAGLRGFFGAVRGG